MSAYSAMTQHPCFLGGIESIRTERLLRNRHGQEHPINLRIQRWRRFPNISRTCLV
jgi:hypothetical protein